MVGVKFSIYKGHHYWYFTVGFYFWCLQLQGYNIRELLQASWSMVWFKASACFQPLLLIYNNLYCTLRWWIIQWEESWKPRCARLTASARAGSDAKLKLYFWPENVNWMKHHSSTHNYFRESLLRAMTSSGILHYNIYVFKHCDNEACIQEVEIKRWN